MTYKIQRGKPFPLGATWRDGGVNFAIFSENATQVVLCLFDVGDDPERVTEIKLPACVNHIYHGFVEGIGPGQLYGYRVHGPYDPLKGHLFNPYKLLLDPYAKAISGALVWDDACYGYNKTAADILVMDTKDNAAFVPRSVVVNDQFDWSGDVLLDIPYHKSVIYELHVKGFTQLLPDVPDPLKGTFSALAHPAALAHFNKLGITAIELLPVQYFISDHELEQKGLENYWGYNTVGFFAPHTKYASTGTLGEQVVEFKNMVKTLHQHGIEVILDVVYNHTGEGSQLGPTLSFRGIDNVFYYRLEDGDQNKYKDFTGTGNSLDSRQFAVLQLIMDSLRYWVTDMHVDGFRFDLAPALARDADEVNHLSSFFSIIYQDPVISRVKLIAEPWDVGSSGYQVGMFPAGWAEWNGKYRNDMRGYWKGDRLEVKELLLRLLGSPDLYQNNGRTPCASINFITAHDGHTLHDLVTYDKKHNENNGDHNTDGSDENRSKNWGVEGETDDEDVNRSRRKHKKNLLATLLVSQGVPMLWAGDELGHSQQGNNNAYCQNNEISWLNWKKADQALMQFVTDLIKFRKDHPVISQHDWTYGEEEFHSGSGNATFFKPSGKRVPFQNAGDCEGRTIGVLLTWTNSKNQEDENHDAQPCYIIFNNSDAPVLFVLPKVGRACWTKVIDTEEASEHATNLYDGNITVAPFSMVIMNKSAERP